MDKESLRQHIILLFEGFNKADKQTLFKLYFDRLSRYDIDTVCKRIEYLIDTAKFFPTIGEILDPIGIKVESQMEKNWMEFKTTMCNNFLMRPMKDWVYTIKTQIGEKRCEDILESEVHWLKKEYDRVYPLVKSGTIEMRKEQQKYLQLTNGMTVCIDEEVDMAKYPQLAQRINEEQKLLGDSESNK